MYVCNFDTSFTYSTQQFTITNLYAGCANLCAVCAQIITIAIHVHTIATDSTAHARPTIYCILLVLVFLTAKTDTSLPLKHPVDLIT